MNKRKSNSYFWRTNINDYSCVVALNSFPIQKKSLLKSLGHRKTSSNTLLYASNDENDDDMDYNINDSQNQDDSKSVENGNYLSPFSLSLSDDDSDEILMATWKSASFADEDDDTFGKDYNEDEDEDEDEDDENDYNDENDNDGDENYDTSSFSKMNNNEQDATMQRIEEQQRQIDLLMKIVQQQNENPSNENKENMSSSLSTASTSDTSDSSSMNDEFPDTSVPLESMKIKNEKSTNEGIEPGQNPFAMSSSSTIAPSTGTTNMNMNMGIVAPLKAMMFIDGTWLYYSIHERKNKDCPVVAKFGRGWQNSYKVNWAALPRIVCEQLQKQQMDQGWSSSSNNNQDQSIRPVEIVRASVFTSYKKTTDRNSLRVRMFNEMNEANYDVHLMETLGSGEKCVDIQLAVEMLHYATVPNAYDVAIMLSGDKDFMPALVRTRQKGKQTAIVSMKMGCNRALYQSPHVKDYDIVWLDDFLDRFIVKMTEESAPYRQIGFMSPTITLKVIHDFISQASGRVSSRDIGRYLKSIGVGDGDKNILTQLKNTYAGGLKSFIRQYGRDIFDITEKENFGRDKRDMSFWVGINYNAREFVMSDVERENFSEEETKFMETFFSQSLNQKKIDDFSFYHTFEDPNTAAFRTPQQNVEIKLELPSELTEDYSKYTVIKLKDRCRERGLMVSGTKAVLLQRVMDDVEEQTNAIQQYQKELQRQKQQLQQQQQQQQHRNQRIQRIQKPIMGSRLGMGGGNPNGSIRREINSSKPYNGAKNVEMEVVHHLDNLIKEFIHANGGQAGSRNLGRYLTANSSSKGRNQQMSALTELKNNFGTLRQFLANRKDVFMEGDRDDSLPPDYGFPVRLRLR